MIISLGLVVSHQVVYKQFIVPRLTDWNNIPMVWQLLVFFPIIIAISLVSIRISKLGQFLIVALTSASITELFIYFMFTLNEYGFRNQPIEENSFFTKRFLFIVIGYAICISFIWLCANIVRKLSKRFTSAAL